MPDSLRMAFKEWAVICEALGRGMQALILRKGGIAEEKGLFTPDHPRFWLYPTYVHQQQQDGIRPEALPLLREVQASPHPSGVVRLSHFAVVSGVFRVDHLPTLLGLNELHIWSPETVEKRFHYREPGLFVLPVRVFRVASAVEHAVKPEYEGCKTWVDLGEEIPLEGAAPVLGDREYHDFLEKLDRRSHPSGVA
jgi:hypothetical protein